MSGHVAVALDGATALFTTRRGGVSEGPYDVAEPRACGPTTTRARRREPRARARAGRRRAASRRAARSTARACAGRRRPRCDGRRRAGRRRAAATRRAIVLVADCLPIALAAPEARRRDVHAGWRGLAGGVVAEGVARAARARREPDRRRRSGRGARGCCYEVGDEVRAAFGRHDRGAAPSTSTAIARDAARAAGVDEVHDVGLCTICASDPTLFFTHRRDGGVTGRQAGVVWRS